MQGLTAAEVTERTRAGQVNRPPRSEWRDYLQILRRNLVNWFNVMVAPAAVALFYLREFPGGVAVSGMAIVNSTLGLFQEIRAKHHLDKLAILVESKARVVRDGQEQTIPASAVVRGDTIRLRTGETVLADGAVLESQFLEVDEALFTGESDPVRRQVGARLLSGSVCVAGAGAYRADDVGAAAFAYRTAAQARRYHYVQSPLTVVINRLIQILTLTAVLLVALYTLAYVLDGFPKTTVEKATFVKMIAATITSMVPQGLVLTATFSFTLGAMVMSRRGAIVQRLNAVEAMAAIDVICTDKTGTLTTNQLRLATFQVLAAELGDEGVKERVRAFVAATVDKTNRNIQALRAALGETPAELLDQVPFKSQNRYSAVRIRIEGTERVLVLGALEALRSRLDLYDARLAADLATRAHELQHAGQRLMVFGTQPGDATFLQDPPRLPELALQPLALIGLGDELRPEAGAVLESLHAQGIAFKVISGDNPETVQGTMSHLRVPLAHDPVVTGAELSQATNKAELIRTRSVFGRVAPEQKLDIVATLQHQGFHVAMIGDGVNDVLPIKRADLGIAMGEGSQASKTVAGLVLENNNFALLPETLEEGRTIVRNLRRSSKLFLVKNVYSLIFILAYLTGLGGAPFPYVPQQVTLLNWLVIGFPAFVIALSRERSQTATRPRFLREVGSFALRTGVVFGLAGLVILMAAASWHPDDERTQRTMLLSALILLGITALFRALTDGESQTLVGDRRFRVLGILAVPVYLLAMYWPLAAEFFELVPLKAGDWLLVLGVATAAYGLSLVSDWATRKLTA